MSRTVRVALVGCGQIADAHLQEIRKIPQAQLVAVCDRHKELAEQAAARFGVPATFSDLAQMLAEAKPDVLHVTTPPQTHCAIAKQALAAGVHVYVEKPFTVDVREADDILNASQTSGRLVCVGHDQLYDPTWLECRRIQQRGDLGQVVHIDSFQGYHLDGPFGKALLDDPDHWVHRLPGGLFQNVVSHAVYRVTEFIPDENPRIWATWFGKAGVAQCPTEMRVLIRGQQTTANICFSSQARPAQRLTRILGSKRSIEVDLEARQVRPIRGPVLPGPFGKIEVPFRQIRDSFKSLTKSLWRFLRTDLHYFAGMNLLFRRFYDAILTNSPPPIPPSEIRRVTAIMDSIFRCCHAEQAELSEGQIDERVNGHEKSRSHGRNGIPRKAVDSTTDRSGSRGVLHGACGK